MNVGIMGAPIDNGNLGCMALTYSLVNSLETVSKRMGEPFEYYIFDGTNNKVKIEEFSHNLSIPSRRIHSMRPGYLVLNNFRRFFCRTSQNVRLLYGVFKCKCIIDVTAGDSFADIYGEEIFIQRTNAKLLLHYLHKPYLLAPQTYGPFIPKNEKKAGKAIAGADIVMARDQMSLELAKQLSCRDVMLIDDLAFQLPYEKKKNKEEQILVGINVSGLLWSNKSEKTEKDFITNVNYDEYIRAICRYLGKNKHYKAFFIPHVEIDYKIHRELHEEFPEIELICPFRNPMEAKGFISKMDIFIGARMHGTIAAFSSGVACIPTGYSRKFVGLFETLGYYRTIDMEKMSTEQAIEKTMSEITEYKQLQAESLECMKGVEMRNNLFCETVEKWIDSIKQKKIRFCVDRDDPVKK